MVASMNGLLETAARMTLKPARKQYNQLLRSALILYASETGTSEDAAHSLGRMFERLYFDVEVKAMDEVQLVSHVSVLSSWAFLFSSHAVRASVLCSFTFLVSCLVHSLATLVFPLHADYVIVGPPPHPKHNHLRRLYNRPRRHTLQRHPTLEESSPQKTPRRRSKPSLVHHLRLRRLQLPKIQLGRTKTPQAS